MKRKVSHTIYYYSSICTAQHIFYYFSFSTASLRNKRRKISLRFDVLDLHYRRKRKDILQQGKDIPESGIDILHSGNLILRLKKNILCRETGIPLEKVCIRVLEVGLRGLGKHIPEPGNLMHEQRMDAHYIQSHDLDRKRYSSSWKGYSLPGKPHATAGKANDWQGKWYAAAGNDIPGKGNLMIEQGFDAHKIGNHIRMIENSKTKIRNNHLHN